MFVGTHPKPLSDTDKVLASLEKLPHEFHCTGSRYFGTATATSDWDFFVQECSEIQKSLIAIGFCRVKNKYTDKNTVCVYQHASANVHVQVVKDAALKARIQLAIKENKCFFLLTGSKPQNRATWDLLFELANGKS